MAVADSPVNSEPATEPESEPAPKSTVEPSSPAAANGDAYAAGIAERLARGDSEQWALYDRLNAKNAEIKDLIIKGQIADLEARIESLKSGQNLDLDQIVDRLFALDLNAVAQKLAAHDREKAKALANALWNHTDPVLKAMIAKIDKQRKSAKSKTTAARSAR